MVLFVVLWSTGPNQDFKVRNAKAVSLGHFQSNGQKLSDTPLNYALHVHHAGESSCPNASPKAAACYHPTPNAATPTGRRRRRLQPPLQRPNAGRPRAPDRCCTRTPGLRRLRRLLPPQRGRSPPRSLPALASVAPIPTAVAGRAGHTHAVGRRPPKATTNRSNPLIVPLIVSHRCHNDVGILIWSDGLSGGADEAATAATKGDNRLPPAHFAIEKSATSLDPGAPEYQCRFYEQGRCVANPATSSNEDTADAD
ncbi:uncharacterized protein LOC107303550 [Oryza brachyantha]|uniref:uncharacterized protein LOC107303550 n=1 Tax=Oryza brachyantha TaxID=4533 RepID=UPI001ADC2C65|nr:uncharacterized protein LOC107303550 [Oryza brachyantha]